MSVVSMMLGLKPVEFPKPKRDYGHLQKINDRRRDDAINRLRSILRDLIMSTSDIAKRMGIERATCARYMAKLEKLGIIERVGETIHPGDNARVMVWRFTEQFLNEE